MSLTRAAPLPHREVLGPYAAVLGRLVPEWAALGGEPPTGPLLGEALLRLLRAMAPQGCVVVLEDVHWADPETLAVLEYVCDHVADAAVLLAITLRDTDGGRAGPLADALVARDSALAADLAARAGDPAAAELFGMAGRRAARDGALDSAAALLVRGRALARSTAQRAALADALADVHCRAGRLDAAVTATHDLDALLRAGGDHPAEPLRRRAHVRLARAFAEAARWDDAEAELAAVTEPMGPESPRPAPPLPRRTRSRPSLVRALILLGNHDAGEAARRAAASSSPPLPRAGPTSPVRRCRSWAGPRAAATATPRPPRSNGPGRWRSRTTCPSPSSPRSTSSAPSTCSPPAGATGCSPPGAARRPRAPSASARCSTCSSWRHTTCTATANPPRPRPVGRWTGRRRWASRRCG